MILNIVNKLPLFMPLMFLSTIFSLMYLSTKNLYRLDYIISQCESTRSCVIIIIDVKKNHHI